MFVKFMERKQFLLNGVCVVIVYARNCDKMPEKLDEIWVVLRALEHFYSSIKTLSVHFQKNDNPPFWFQTIKMANYQTQDLIIG